MSAKAQITEMAAYTRWQNETLTAVCDSLDKAALSEERGMFFGSILRTLDHILMVDETLLLFVKTGEPPSNFDPKKSVVDDFTAFTKARPAFDQSLKEFIDGTQAPWFEEEIRFFSPRHGRDRAFPRWFLFSQIFNHATHHRSQITSELHKMGLDYGNTDMPYNPLSQF